MSYDTNTSVSFWVASEVGLWSFIIKSISKQNLCPVKLTWRVKTWIGVFTLIPEKKVNFEQDQLWEKEAKSASRSGGRKEARREGARPLSRGFQVWDVNFLNYMFSFCFSFRYTAFLSGFVLFIIKNRDLWVQFSCGYVYKSNGMLPFSTWVLWLPIFWNKKLN